MEFLSSFATINNFTALVLLAIIIALIVGVKTGNLKFSGKGLEVGSSDRRLLQSEWDLAKAIVECIPVEEEDYEHLVVREQLLDKAQQWVAMNNLNLSKSYIKTKQYAIKSIPKIYEILDDPDKFVEMLLSELVDLKEGWNK